jgi:hypothetical protein
LGFGRLDLGCLDFGWLPWRTKYHCGLQAWNVKHRNQGTKNQALLPKLVPSLSNQPHVESKSRANTKSLYDVGISPRKTRIQIHKMTKKIDRLHYFHPTLNINPIIQSPTPTRKAINRKETELQQICKLPKNSLYIITAPMFTESLIMEPWGSLLLICITT